MSFDLDIDAARWRAHIDSVAAGAASIPDCHLVPVIKGQGYGLGADLLLAEATRIGASTVALGTIAEVPGRADVYAGHQLVLQPYDHRDESARQAWQRLATATASGRLLRTVASPEVLRTLAASALADPRSGGRIVIEGLTSMRRFGMSPREMAEVVADESVRTALSCGALTLHGLALHLPLTDPRPSRVDQVLVWAQLWSDLTATGGAGPASHGADAAGSPARSLWVSHLSDADLATVRAATTMTLRPRIGSRLWHGERSALRAGGTVLAVHPLDGPEPVGYRQRSGERGATLVVVAGGTSHGVALSPASSTPRVVRSRRSTSAARRSGSPSRRTCRCRSCVCRAGSPYQPWATRSTSTCASPGSRRTASSAWTERGRKGRITPLEGGFCP